MRTQIIFLCLALMSIVSCSQPYKEQLVKARQAFDEGHYLDAYNRFGSLYEQYPDDPQVSYGYAHLAHVFHEYEKAWPAYERTLEDYPNDGHLAELYLNALAWGGLLRKDRQVLEKAVIEGRRFLIQFPNRPELYDDLATALRELGSGSAFSDTLASLQALGIDSPVLDIEYIDAKLQAAREDSVETVRLKAELLASLDAEEDFATDYSELYLHAAGRLLLDEKEKADSLLKIIEETEEGRHMASPIRWRHYFYGDIFETYGDQDIKARADVTNRWEKRFVPKGYTVNGPYRVLLRTRLDAWMEIARTQAVDTSATPVSQERLAEIVELGERLAVLDTWGGASYYLRIGRFLVDQEANLDEAVRVIEQGIEELEQDRPGLIYPGARGDSRTRAVSRSIAQLKGIQGEALAKSGHIEEAEPLLRAAVEGEPSARLYGVLGQFLVKQNNREEGIDALITALAYDSDDREAELRSEWQSVLDEAVREEQLLTFSLEDAIAQRQQELKEQHEHDLIADRLDSEVSDFELNDLSDQSWRLSKLNGDIVILNYGSMYCGFCMEQYPHYQQLVDEYRDDETVTFLAISMDDNHQSVRRWYDDEDYTFTVLFDEGTGIENSIFGTPTILIIDPLGRLQYRSVGFGGAESFLEEMRLRIEALREGSTLAAYTPSF